MLMAWKLTPSSEHTGLLAEVGAEIGSTQTKYSFMEKDPYETLEASAMAMAAVDADASSGAWDEDELDLDDLEFDGEEREFGAYDSGPLYDGTEAVTGSQRASDAGTGAFYTDDGADSALQMFESVLDLRSTTSKMVVFDCEASDSPLAHA